MLTDGRDHPFFYRRITQYAGPADIGRCLCFAGRRGRRRGPQACRRGRCRAGRRRHRADHQYRSRPASQPPDPPAFHRRPADRRAAVRGRADAGTQPAARPGRGRCRVQCHVLGPALVRDLCAAKAGAQFDDPGRRRRCRLAGARGDRHVHRHRRFYAARPAHDRRRNGRAAERPFPASGGMHRGRRRHVGQIYRRFGHGLLGTAFG